MGRKLLLLLLAICITGCSKGATPAPQHPTPTVPVSTDTQTPVNLTPVAKPAPDNSKPAEVTVPVKQPGGNPVIVQSAPADDTEIVLNEISQELDNLAKVLNDLETADTAWEQEVNEP